MRGLDMITYDYYRIFPREEKAEYLFDKILENPQACERLMETFYESVESDGEYSGEVLPPEKFAKALFDAYKNKDLTAFLLAICQVQLSCNHLTD